MSTPDPTEYEAHRDTIRAELGLPTADRRTEVRRQHDRDLLALRGHLTVAVAGRHDRRATRSNIRSLVTLVRSMDEVAS